MAMSEAAKLKLSEAMKARHEAKRLLTEEQRQEEARLLNQQREDAQAAKTALSEGAEDAADPQPDLEPTISQTEYRDLLRQIEELKRNSFPVPPQAPGQAALNRSGQLVGTFEKYVIDPKHYPDPTPRLSKEPRLQRFAFPINYELHFQTDAVRYQTLDGIWTREPKFTLQLIKVVVDEDTGERTDGRYVLRTLILHEDPQAAILVARENGLEVDEHDEKAFLDEMRYLRMRDWLLDAFYRPKVAAKKNRKEMVIGNRVVEYYEVSSLDPTGINFDGLQGKL